MMGPDRPADNASLKAVQAFDAADISCLVSRSTQGLWADTPIRHWRVGGRLLKNALQQILKGPKPP